MTHQSKNLRAGIPIRFPTVEAERAYEAEVGVARRLQRAAFAVAPRCKVRLPRSGEERYAGEAVTASDFEGATFTVGDGNGGSKLVVIPAWKALRNAVEEGLVLEGDRPDHAAT